MDYNEAVAYLNNLEQFGSQLGLSRIRPLLHKLSNPQDSLKCFHVAGTNGKGSVCAMISSILQEAGYKVGMYTSPHLVDFKERFLINNKKISEADVAELATRIKPLADEVAKEIGQVTHFEFITAMAFEYFKIQNVDYAVIEVGLGGRLDATNVISNPFVSVITSIDLEHTDVLGNTIHEIAFEKAGIIKEKVPVVASANDEAYRIIKRIADSEKSKVRRVAKKYNGLLGLQGDFQKSNAAVAAEAIKAAGIDIPSGKIASGLEKAVWPGRIDLRSIRGKSVLFDSAHNPAGVRVLIPELKKFEFDRLILVASILKDKDYKTMLNGLAPNAKLAILTRVNNLRTAEPLDLAKCITGYKIIAANSADAVELALAEAGKDDLILVTGSIYLLGEAMSYLNAKVF